METNHRKSFMKAIESYFNKAGDLKNYDEAGYCDGMGDINREGINGETIKVEKLTFSVSPNDPEHIIIENVNYVKFTEDFNSMIENNWVPYGKVILKTDKFTQKFMKR